MKLELIEPPIATTDWVQFTTTPPLAELFRSWRDGRGQPEATRHSAKGRNVYENIKIKSDQQLIIGQKYDGDFPAGKYTIHNFIPVRELDALTYECVIDYFTPTP